MLQLPHLLALASLLQRAAVVPGYVVELLALGAELRREVTPHIQPHQSIPGLPCPQLRPGQAKNLLEPADCVLRLRAEEPSTGEILGMAG